MDLLCALLVPPECTDEHLEVLAQLSEIFRQADLREKLRTTHDPEQICLLLSQWTSKEQRE